MAHILIMPRQGNTVESCIITGWKVKEGDKVSAQTVVCEVETDKAAFEVPAGEAGTILKILHAQSDDVPVLEPIAVIGTAGEDWQAALAAASTQGISHEDTKVQGTVPALESLSVNLHASVTSAPVSEANSEISISPRARNLAEKEALPLESVPALAAAGSGPGGRIIERDISAALQNRPGLTAAARAAGTGTIPQAGSGIGGRVTAAELSTSPGTVEPSVRGSLGEVSGVLASQQQLLTGEGKITETPIKGIRKIISDRMHQSLSESAQFTLNASAPAQKLQDLRSRMKNSTEETGLSKITINDLILFAVSRILPQFPFMNAHKTGGTLKTFERVHLGLAVDTPRGLVVPVIRNASLLSLTQISSEAKRLAAACQNSSVKPDEIYGSTFTVTNLGSLGITSFTPILNAPEVAILGVCAIELKPTAAACDCGSSVCFEPHIGFSLTINHQVVDGAPAARFLKALCEAVAEIDLFLANQESVCTTQ